jgi:predicted PurR-regulated permease PerM
MVIGLILVVRSARDILLLVWLGIVFGVFLEASGRGVHKLLRLPRPWAAGTALLLLLAAAAGMLVWLLPQIATQAMQLAERLPQAFGHLEDQLRASEWGHAIIVRLSGIGQHAQLTQETARRFLGIFSSAIGTSRSSALRWWLAGRLLSVLVVFLLTWIGLGLLDIPLPFLLTLIAGLLSFIPNIGPVISAVPAVVLGLGQGPLMPFMSSCCTSPYRRWRASRSHR